MTTLIRTTIQPWLEIEVDDAELAWLTRWNLIWPAAVQVPAEETDMSLGPTSATVSNVTAVASAAATLFAEALGSVDARYVFNDSTAVLYLKYGSGASSTSHTAQVKPGGFWEAPSPPFRGLITGIWASATGTARCTEA